MTELVCIGVKFYSEYDEISFFNWLKNIPEIKNIKGFGNEIRLSLENQLLTDASLRELIAIFHRYNISMFSLAQFVTDDNRYWFKDNNKAYWHNSVFANLN